MSRFVKLPSFFFENELLYFNEVWINPFQVEAYVSLDMTYTDENGIEVELGGTKIFTKSGFEYDINMPVSEVEKLLQ